MQDEIERKFLVTSEAWRPLVARMERLEDGLLDGAGEGRIRVRISGDRAKLTVKGPRRGITRREFEYDIPLAHAREMVDTLCAGRVVAKTRHYVPVGGLTWEVDVYHGPLSGVTMAELELTSEDQPFERPVWIGREITHEPAFRKSALIARAFPDLSRQIQGVPAA